MKVILSILISLLITRTGVRNGQQGSKNRKSEIVLESDTEVRTGQGQRNGSEDPPLRRQKQTPASKNEAAATEAPTSQSRRPHLQASGCGTQCVGMGSAGP